MSTFTTSKFSKPLPSPLSPSSKPQNELGGRHLGSMLLRRMFRTWKLPRLASALDEATMVLLKLGSS
jgi:hypothetical protein